MTGISAVPHPPPAAAPSPRTRDPRVALTGPLWVGTGDVPVGVMASSTVVMSQPVPWGRSLVHFSWLVCVAPLPLHCQAPGASRGLPQGQTSSETHSSRPNARQHGGATVPPASEDAVFFSHRAPGPWPPALAPGPQPPAIAHPHPWRGSDGLAGFAGSGHPSEFPEVLPDPHQGTWAERCLPCGLFSRATGSIPGAGSVC